MTEDDKRHSERSSEIRQPAELAGEERSTPSNGTYPSSGGKIREGISPFWPVLIIVVLLGGAAVGAVRWIASLNMAAQENEVIETAMPIEAVPDPMPPVAVNDPQLVSTPTATKKAEAPIKNSPINPYPVEETMKLNTPVLQEKTPRKKSEPRSVEAVTPAVTKPILEGLMLKRPDPPIALLTALAEVAKGDSAESLAVIHEHAKAGWPEAQTALGLALIKGQTIPQDTKKAVENFRKAAEQNDASAQYHLGQAYLHGSGVKADPIQAMAWFILAASHGHAAALTERDNRLATLSPSDRHSAFIRVGNLGPEVFAGWSHDPKSHTAVWLPSWYRTGSYSLKVEVPAVDGYAQGQGKVVIQASLPGDSDRVFEGYFSRGYYFGDRERDGEFQFLPTNDFLFRLPTSQDQGDRGVAFWLRVDFGSDFAANPCYDAVNRTPDLVTVVPDDFQVLNDEVAKNVMGEAWQTYLDVCPENYHVKLTVVPPAFGFGKDRFGHRIFVPQFATGSFYGKRTEKLTVSNFVNHARRAHEEEQKKLTKEREQEERQQKKRNAAAAAKTRGNPDIRGLRLGMTLAEVHAQLEGEIAEWKPRWNPDRTLSPFEQFEQSIKLTDGARFSASFTSPVNSSVLYAIVYEQDLRNGPDKTQLIANLEAKYGKPDDSGNGGVWWDYQLVSRVDEGLGAFMKVHYRTDSGTNKVEYLRLIINDAGFGSYDERTAYGAKVQAKQEAYEASKSDKPKF